MSVHEYYRVRISCDHPGCREVHECDLHARSVGWQRKAIKAEGWQFVRRTPGSLSHPRDLCPKHAHV